MSLAERFAVCLEYLFHLKDEWDAAAGLPISQAQLQFIIWLGEHPNCRLQHIATGLNLAPPTVSVGIKHLEKLGLVERYTDPADQRAISLVLSPDGEKLYALATQARSRQMSALLEHLKPSEQRQMVELLERLLGITPTEEEESAPQEPAPPAGTIQPESSPPEAPTQLSLFGS